MNIITNSCVGGYLYKDYFKIPYENPFIWSYIDFNSFIYLMMNFKTINYKNIRIENNNHIIIDDKVDVHYLHYIKDNSCSKPTFVKKDNTIRYSNIEDYTLDKYLRRLSRMNIDDNPIFIFAHSYIYLNKEQLNKLNDISLQYECLIYNDIIANLNNEKCHIYKCPIKHNNKQLTDYIYNHLRDSKILSTGILS